MKVSPVKVNPTRLLELAAYFHEDVNDIPLTAIKAVHESETTYAMLIENDMGGEAPPTLFAYVWRKGYDGKWDIVSTENDFPDVDAFRNFLRDAK